VFAITNGGDIKPARMADLYLFYTHRSAKPEEQDKGDQNKEDQNTAGVQWPVEYAKASEEVDKMMSGHHSTTSLQCDASMLIFTKAFAHMGDWAVQNKKEWQMVIDHTDEEGDFRVSVYVPGEYELFVKGQAGFNKAVWRDDHITISPGVETKVKMASPDVACLITSD
jgi:hypothetical protein